MNEQEAQAYIQTLLNMDLQENLTQEARHWMMLALHQVLVDSFYVFQTLVREGGLERNEAMQVHLREHDSGFYATFLKELSLIAMWPDIEILPTEEMLLENRL